MEVRLRLYINEKTRYYDVDNLLKQVLDALQGRCGGPKRIPPDIKVINNDRQVRRVIIEKGPTKSRRASHLAIRVFRAGRLGVSRHRRRQRA